MAGAIFKGNQGSLAGNRSIQINVKKRGFAGDVITCLSKNR
jgi:hypothetical protein